MAPRGICRIFLPSAGYASVHILYNMLKKISFYQKNSSKQMRRKISFPPLPERRPLRPLLRLFPTCNRAPGIAEGPAEARRDLLIMSLEHFYLKRFAFQIIRSVASKKRSFSAVFRPGGAVPPPHVSPFSKIKRFVPHGNAKTILPRQDAFFPAPCRCPVARRVAARSSPWI